MEHSTYFISWGYGRLMEVRSKIQFWRYKLPLTHRFGLSLNPDSSYIITFFGQICWD